MSDQPTAALEACRFLVASSDEEVRDAFAYALEVFGAAEIVVCETTTSAAALLFGADSPPDLLICGMRTAPHDGLGLVRTVRRFAEPAVARIPIVLFDFRPTRRDLLAAIEAGADDLIRMPTPAREVVRRVRRCLLKRSAERPVAAAKPLPRPRPAV